MDQRNAQKRLFPLLIVENNQDQQLIIQYSLRTSMPQAKAVFASTALETMKYLQIASGTVVTNFPRLILLSIHVSQDDTDWQLLKNIRLVYPLLPVVVLSNIQDDEVIRKAYELGVSSFMVKPTSLESWENCFLVFNMYWSGVVTLPPVGAWRY
jgi:CheY-like chemotaxis protein